MTNLPLQGIRVADFSQGVAGPHASLLLAQYGADVIKIEPRAGDWSRRLGRNRGSVTAFSLFYNRGKRSIALDMRSDDGRKLASQIAAGAHVVVEAFRPGVMTKFGLGYDELAKSNPDLVYLSVTGFGQRGPNARKPATDAIIQGYSGLMALNRDKDGVPQRFPMIVVDVVSGLYGFQAVMAALMKSHRFGGGQHIDCSLLQCAIALRAPRILEGYFENGKPEAMYVPLGVLATSDGFVSISVNQDPHFIAFCKAVEREEWIADPRYADRLGRVRHEKELMQEIRREFAKRSTAEWADRLESHGVLHSTIRSYSDVLDDPETERAGFVDWLDQNDMITNVPVPNIPGARRAREFGPLSTCPEIGEHSAEILREMGVDARLVDDYVQRGVVGPEQMTVASAQRPTGVPATGAGGRPA